MICWGIYLVIFVLGSNDRKQALLDDV